MNRVVQKAILCIKKLVRSLRGIFYQPVARAEKIIVTAVLADGENIVQRHVLIFMSRYRLQSVRCLVEAEHPISFIAKEQTGLVFRIDSKEVVRAQFAIVDDITLCIYDDRIIRCSGNTGFQDSHSYTCQP